jgi:hypothetical protein
MKLKTGMRFEERAGKEVYLVNSDKELLITGIAEPIATRLYFSEMSEDELEKDVPGARQALQGLREWIE